MGDSRPDFRFEKAALARGNVIVCGIDEAGRGPLAGPVIAAAVILDGRRIPRGINDSKRLRAEEREAAFRALARSARIGIGIGDVERIDRDNILQATLWAMSEALRQLGEVTLALVDGNQAPEVPCAVETIVDGDARCLSIAAASIVAKVTRDRLMTELDCQYPGYGFARHKGYGTAAHHEALQRLGPCVLHRRSFAPVAALLAR